MRFQIIVYLIVFLVGITGGFYLALYFQNQIALLAGIAVLFAFLTWLGSGADLLGLLREWYKETRLVPKLTIEFSGNYKDMATFSPELELINLGKPTGIIQKYLKVRVTNTGGLAHRCKGNFRLIKWESKRAPSDASKPLVWEGRSFERDIYAKVGSELLNVVFSDSTFNERSDDIHALISMDENLYPPQRNIILAQHAFGEGIFDVEVTVISEEGASAKSQFMIYVDKDFRKLRMKLLS